MTLHFWIIRAHSCTLNFFKIYFFCLSFPSVCMILVVHVQHSTYRISILIKQSYHTLNLMSETLSSQITSAFSTQVHIPVQFISFLIFLRYDILKYFIIQCTCQLVIWGPVLFYQQKNRLKENILTIF